MKEIMFPDLRGVRVRCKETGRVTNMAKWEMQFFDRKSLGFMLVRRANLMSSFDGVNTGGKCRGIETC